MREGIVEESGAVFAFFLGNRKTCCYYGSHLEWKLLEITVIHHTCVSVDLRTIIVATPLCVASNRE
jgi:hypothetical protein